MNPKLKNRTIASNFKYNPPPIKKNSDVEVLIQFAAVFYLQFNLKKLQIKSIFLHHCYWQCQVT